MQLSNTFNDLASALNTALQTQNNIIDVLKAYSKMLASNAADIPAELVSEKDANIISGAASFNALDNNYLKALVVDIALVQSGSGTPSPTNVRTISGHTEEAITITGDETEKTITIPFGQTVYRGTLDVLNGVLTVTHTLIDLGDLTWEYATDNTYNVFYTPVSALAKAPASSLNPPETDNISDSSIFKTLKCMSFSNFANNDNGNNTLCFVAYGQGATQRILIRCDTYTDIETFTAAMSGAQLAYKIATPTVIQLNKQQINVLLGQNNISASTGDVLTCKYTYEITTTDLDNLKTVIENNLAYIKCTETTADTYMLTATVDSEGAVTYNWTSTT